MRSPRVPVVGTRGAVVGERGGLSTHRAVAIKPAEVERAGRESAPVRSSSVPEAAEPHPIPSRTVANRTVASVAPEPGVHVGAGAPALRMFHV